MTRHAREDYFSIESTKTTHIRFVIDRIVDERFAVLLLDPPDDAHETARVQLGGEMVVPLELLPPDVSEGGCVEFSVEKMPNIGCFSGDTYSPNRTSTGHTREYP